MYELLTNGFPGGARGNVLAKAGDAEDLGSIPGLGRSPVGGHGNQLQWATCPENPMIREAWQARVHGVAKSQTQLKWLSMHKHPKYTSR